jgi:hypothetical protein
MGLTIHYRIEAHPHWTRRQIREKLADTRRFALSLPLASVGDVVEFRGKQCDWQSGEQEGQTPDEAEAKDPHRWAKIQASRYVESPWRPGLSCGQSPAHMLLLSIWPAEGCEQMNLGWCSFPRFVWKPDKADSPCAAGWSQVLRSPSHHRESAKVLRGFMKKYRLAKMPDRQVHHHRWSQCSRDTILDLDGASVTIWASYLSHRRGYGPGRIELSLPDYQEGRIGFRFRGTVEEGRELFQSPAFRADLKDMLYGKEHVIPAEHGAWSSFCKTQYANDPRLGGWDNFQRAHLSVCAILEHLDRIGFKVHVNDEGHFWEKRDLAALANEIGEWDAMLAGLGGVLKDAAEAQAAGFESAMSGRPDFEHLEAQALKIPSIAEHLARLREQLLPVVADEKEPSL